MLWRKNLSTIEIVENVISVYDIPASLDNRFDKADDNTCGINVSIDVNEKENVDIIVSDYEDIAFSNVDDIDVAVVAKDVVINNIDSNATFDAANITVFDVIVVSDAIGSNIISALDTTDNVGDVIGFDIVSALDTTDTIMVNVTSPIIG